MATEFEVANASIKRRRLRQEELATGDVPEYPSHCIEFVRFRQLPLVGRLLASQPGTQLTPSFVATNPERRRSSAYCRNAPLKIPSDRSHAKEFSAGDMPRYSAYAVKLLGFSFFSLIY